MSGFLGLRGKETGKENKGSVLSLGFQETIRTTCGQQPSQGGGDPEGSGVKILR